MLSSEQGVMNALAMGDDDILWSWLMDQVDKIATDKPFQSEKVLYEEPFRSSMSVNFVDGRIHVRMESFGYAIGYSWELMTDPKTGHKYLSKFRIEEE